MKKNYFILLIGLLMSLFSFSQNLKFSGKKEVPKEALMELQKVEKKHDNKNKTISCIDTSYYPAYKGGGAFGVMLNSDGGVYHIALQRYNVNRQTSVLGANFFLLTDFDNTPGDAPSVNLNMYLYNYDSAADTIGQLIAIQPVVGQDVGFDYQSFSFSNAVNVNSDFVIGIGPNNFSNDSIMIVENDPNANDGRGEGLAFYGYETGGASLDFQLNLNGVGSDMDWMIFPIVQHSLTAGFSANDICLNVGETINLTNTSSWVAENDSMFNILGIVGETNYDWEFGDGVTATTLNTSHSYAAAGKYTITLRDSLFGWSNTCVENATLDVSVGLATTVSASSNPQCNGGSDGSITLNGSGGATPYTYSSDNVNFSSTNPLTGFSSGNNTVYIKDDLGCTASVVRNLGQPSAVNINSQTSTPASCGGNDGTITFSAIGGTGTKTYSVDGTNYQASGNFTGLAATTYTLYAKDNNGCVQMSSISVGNAGAPSINSVPSNAVTCNGGNNGTLTINGSGGTGSLTYSIDGVNFFSTNTFNNLTSNTYTVTVRDASLCTASQNVFVSQPAPITANAGNDQSVCQDNPNISLSGVIDVATGYSWSAIGGGTFSSPSSQNTTFAPTATQITNGLATVVLTTDNNGTCNAATDTMVLTINAAPIVDAGLDLTVCSNNSISVLAGMVSNAGGGVWSSTLNGSFSPNTTTLDADYTNSAVGNDTLVLESTGNGLCAAVYDTMIVTITPSPSVDAGLTGFSICEGDTVPLDGSVTVGTGGVWTTNGSGSVLDSVSLITGYIITDTDATNGSVVFTLTSTGNGNCLANTDNSFWFPVPGPEFQLQADTTLCVGGTVTLNVGLGADYSYEWSNSEMTEIIDVTTSGNYSVTVTDTNTCEATDAVNITFETCGSIDNSLSSSVSLYPNPSNGIVFVTTEMNEKVSMEVVNILGEIVIEDQLNSKVNNLTVDLSTYNNGVYFFRFTKGNEVITRKINIVK